LEIFFIKDIGSDFDSSKKLQKVIEKIKKLKQLITVISAF